MISAQTRVQQANALQLRRIGSDLVTLLPRNVSAWASIDRVNRPPNKMESEISIQGEVGVTVYIRKADLNDPPKKGEYIQEANEDTHIIGEVKDLGQRWQLTCSSEPL